MIPRDPVQPLTHFLRSPGNTLDIAIWSTIEQGLAITAGSLATLRPLIKLLAFRLGLTTKPKSMRPSDYATNSRPLGGSKGGGHLSRGEAYSLSSANRYGVRTNVSVGEGAPAPASNSRQSPLTGKFKVDIKKEIQVTSTGRNESEEELTSVGVWTTKVSSR